MPRARRPTVLYVVDRFPELSQTFVTNEIDELRRQAVHVLVVAVRPGDHLGASDSADWLLDDLDIGRGLRALGRIAVHHPGRALTFFRRVFAMRGAYKRLAISAIPVLAERLADREAVDRVHTHFAWGASSLGAYVAALLGVPLSITAHARDLFVDPQSLQAKLDIADPLVTVCSYNVRWLIENGYQASRVVVVPCGVEVPTSPATPPSSPRVLSIGRMVPKKGFDVLIRAAAIVRTHVPDLVVDIIGDGPQRAELSSLVDELGLQGCVRMPGAMSHEEVLHAFDGTSVFALACRRDDDGDTDALPVVIREAMARGVPVVSSRIAGIPETVTSDVGWIVPPDDPYALAASVLTALQDGDVAARFGAAARARIEELYTSQGCVRQLREAWHFG